MKISYTALSAFIVLFLSSNHIKAQSVDNILKDKLLIVVHMQEYNDKGITKESSADELDHINKIIKFAIPEHVAYTKAMHKILNLTLKKVYVDKQIKDLDNRLDVINEHVFVDHGGDIFSSAELIDFLKEKNFTKIVIIGRVAEECIKTSVKSGLKAGYEMYLIPEAIVGKSDKSKARVIRKLKKKGAHELVLG
ncbi:MAG: isochorismatase family protein [Bacteroidetes bacterium]|nr:isochorismatase family protein [Bacteroidota bacterium]